MNELGPAIALFEELLRERGELMQAISYWRASDRVEAPDRVAEFAELLAELEKEILSMKKRLGVRSTPGPSCTRPLLRCETPPLSGRRG